MQRSLVLLLELGSDEGFTVATEAGSYAGKRGSKTMEKKRVNFPYMLL
jgi:hypothetical protein